ncbi:MAG: hypothetical protein LC804_10840 [Acidobacteria bacterium]|nr:hypothetical protein [Acidobacteriota bacterium]
MASALWDNAFVRAVFDNWQLSGVHNWDATLFKRIPLLSDSRYLQLRWDVYNLFNHTQFSGVDTTARFDPAGNQVNPTFGQINASRAPRIMQVSVRVVF